MSLSLREGREKLMFPSGHLLKLKVKVGLHCDGPGLGVDALLCINGY